MLYIGHFAFARDGNHHGYGPSHGYFTTVIEAPDIETALDKFKTLLHKLREDEDLFDDVNAVFLDACIECHTIPPTGFLAHYRQWLGPDEGSISTSIRGATEDQAVAYESRIDDNDDDDTEGGIIEPFATFPAPKR